MNNTKRALTAKRNASFAAFRAAVEGYFNACDATRERIVLKSGAITYYQTPYTVAGLAAHLQMDRQELERYCAGGYPGRNKKRVQQLLRTAIARVERYTVERALLGELHNGVAGMLLKGWGYGESDASANNANEVVVVMDDAENWSR